MIGQISILILSMAFATINGQCTGTQQDLVNGMLYQTNIYRNLHCAPSLTVDSSMSVGAQAWSLSQAKIKKSVYNFNKNSLYGENIYTSFSRGEASKSCYDLGIEVTQAWYSEAKKYNFFKPGLIAGSSHFSQLLWKSTKTFGAGFATAQVDVMTQLFVTADYFPAGNIFGGKNKTEYYFIQNVLPPKCKTGSG